MKKIEAIIHPSRLKALQSGFRRMGIQSRPVVSSVNRLPHDLEPVLVEELTPARGRLGDPLARKSAELKIELIVSDRQVFKVIDMILALGRLRRRLRSGRDLRRRSKFVHRGRGLISSLENRMPAIQSLLVLLRCS